MILLSLYNPHVLHNIYIVGKLDSGMKRFVFLLMFVLAGAFVFAEMSISEPQDVYNLGDRLYIDLGGLRGASTGNLDIDLVCGNVSVNLVRIPARAFSAGEDQTYSIPYKILDREDLGFLDLSQIVGICQVVASLGGEVASTKSFEVSDDVLVALSVDADSYNPGDAVGVKVEAVKSNGAAVNGFVEGFNASVFSKAIEDGVVEEVFYVPETAEAGIYRLGVRVYDVGAGGVLNEGVGSVSYTVNQVATSLVLSFSDVVASPGENFSIGVEVFDQAGVEMSGNVLVRVISPDGSEIESIVSAGEFSLIEFLSNSSVGTWTIVSQFDDIAQEREFEMAALQKVEFYFEESVLVVKNIGNVVYNKSINVNIGEEIMELDLKIGVGEIRKFNLEAPVGNYDVVVGDGDYEISRQVLLTGNAVSVSDFRDVGIFRSYSVVWIFLIIVLGSVGGVLFMRYRKTRTFGREENFFKRIFGRVKIGGQKSVVGGQALRKRVSDKSPAGVKSEMDSSLNFTKKSPAVQGLDVKNYSASDKSMIDFTREKSVRAESTLVMKGEKQMSAVVALSVKNYGKLGEVAREGLREIV